MHASMICREMLWPELVWLRPTPLMDRSKSSEAFAQVRASQHAAKISYYKTLKPAHGHATEKVAGPACRHAPARPDRFSRRPTLVASYTALAAAAESAGLEQVAQLCRSIIPEEEHMAQRLRENLPNEVQAYLASEAH